jgi:glucosamine kinase
MLQHWEVASNADLRELAWKGWMQDDQGRSRQFGMFAPRVTEAAMQGSTLALRVCDKAIHQLAVGIGMLGSAFDVDTINVAFIGSVINSEYMKNSLTERLNSNRMKQFNIVEPALSPAAGSVLYALNHLDNEGVSETWIRNLQKSS